MPADGHELQQTCGHQPHTAEGDIMGLRATEPLTRDQPQHALHTGEW